MANVSPPLGISEEDWQATPMAVRVVLMELLQRVAQLAARRARVGQSTLGNEGTQARVIQGRHVPRNLVDAGYCRKAITFPA